MSKTGDMARSALTTGFEGIGLGDAADDVAKEVVSFVNGIFGGGGPAKMAPVTQRLMNAALEEVGLPPKFSEPLKKRPYRRYVLPPTMAGREVFATLLFKGAVSFVALGAANLGTGSELDVSKAKTIRKWVYRMLDEAARCGGLPKGDYKYIHERFKPVLEMYGVA